MVGILLMNDWAVEIYGGLQQKLWPRWHSEFKEIFWRKTTINHVGDRKLYQIFTGLWSKPFLWGNSPNALIFPSLKQHRKCRSAAIYFVSTTWSERRMKIERKRIYLCTNSLFSTDSISLLSREKFHLKPWKFSLLDILWIN